MGSPQLRSSHGPRVPLLVQHYWLQGKRPQIDLPETRTKLKEFNAQQKIKGAVFNILAQNVCRCPATSLCCALLIPRPRTSASPFALVAQPRVYCTTWTRADGYLLAADVLHTFSCCCASDWASKAPTSFCLPVRAVVAGFLGRPCPVASQACLLFLQHVEGRRNSTPEHAQASALAENSGSAS